MTARVGPNEAISRASGPGRLGGRQPPGEPDQLGRERPGALLPVRPQCPYGRQVEVVEQRVGVARPVGRRVGQATQQQDADRVGQLAALDRRHHLTHAGAVTAEVLAARCLGRPPGQALEHHHAGRVDIGGRRGHAAGPLFRREVAGRPGDTRMVHRRGHADTGQLHPAVLGDDHVVGADIAVQDAPAVQLAQRLQHPLGQVEGDLGVELAPPVEQQPQGNAVDQLLHDRGRPARPLDELHHAGHVGMLDPVQGGGVGAEPFDEMVGADHVPGQIPDGDGGSGDVVGGTHQYAGRPVSQLGQRLITRHLPRHLPRSAPVRPIR
jgi:hypothetical protein